MNTILNRRNNITVHQAKDLMQKGYTVKMVLPLSLRMPDGDWWLFPIEPLISIAGKNEIIKRSVAKSDKRGTIKERWSEADVQISIQGSFIHPDIYTYPSQNVTDLTNLIRQKTAIEVQNELLQLLDVHQIVIEDYKFPFSKGENVQNYNIEAVSDDLYNLFIDVKDV